MSGRAALILTVLVVVVSMNAVNFVDGLDGLAAGVMAIGGSAFFYYAYMLTRDTLGLRLLLARRAADRRDDRGLSGLPAPQPHPSPDLHGDSASMLLGLLLAASTIAVTGQVDPATLSGADFFGQFLPILLPIGVMVIPILRLRPRRGPTDRLGEVPLPRRQGAPAPPPAGPGPPKYAPRC